MAVQSVDKLSDCGFADVCNNVPVAVIRGALSQRAELFASEKENTTISGRVPSV
jgi:hypothetical protein